MAYKEWDDVFPSILSLVSRGGFHVASVSAMVAASSVSKMTLYKYFGSRDALFAALLEWHSARWREWFFSEVEERAKRPAHQLEAFFEVLEAWLVSGDFSGCVFSHALADFPEPAHPVRQAAAQHKEAVRQYLRSLAKKSGAAKPGQLAQRLELLMEGAVALASDANRAQVAKQVALLAHLAIQDALPSGAFLRTAADTVPPRPKTRRRTKRAGKA